MNTQKQQDTFERVMLSFGYAYELRTIFDDFLIMALAGFSRDPATKQSYDEDRYMAASAKYRDAMNVEETFGKLLGCLILEMDERINQGGSPDILGEFFETHLVSGKNRKQQYFTPWNICRMMADITCDDPGIDAEPLNVADTSCGGGRMLLAASRKLGWRHNYYGIDVDVTCVRMAAVTLFLSGIFHGEIMCADTFRPDSFVESYRLSFVPFGIFRITEKEQSRLWHMQQQVFSKEPTPPNFDENHTKGGGSQLSFF